MTPRYKPYPKYKPSGVEWLGDVPEGWGIKKLKYLSTVNDEVLLETTSPDYGLLYVDIGSVNRVNGITNKEPWIFSKAPSRARRCVKHGDTIVSTVRTYLKAIASVENPESNLVVSTGFAVVRPRNINPVYLGFALRSPFFIENVVARSTGVSYPAINASDLTLIEITLPSSAEQRAIASFLDRETGKIDRLIEKQERMIELLKEKRQAVISHTVTKGLNPDTPLKDSGVEWLGEIPEHWGVTKFGRCSYFQEGPGLRNWQFTDEGVRVICVTNITENGIDFSRYSKFISNEEYVSSYRRFTVENGDLLLSSSGNSWGKVAEYQEDQVTILNTSTIRVNTNPKESLLKGFIKWLLQSETTREQLGVAMTGACQPNFGPSHLNSIMVAIPPSSEQDTITNYVNTAITKIDHLVAKAEQAIELMKERRTALISAAVTGKIDVSTSLNAGMRGGNEGEAGLARTGAEE